MTKLNFTGRKRLDRNRVRLWLTGGPDDIRLSTDRLNFDGLELPHDARIVVEAQHQTNYMRFECGTVEAVAHLGSEPLTEFETPDAILFRVKVIGDGDSDTGKMLAVADRIRAGDVREGNDATDETDEGGTSGSVQLLPFQPHDLEQLTWLLDTTGDRPVVLVNRKLPDWKAFVQNPEFRALVLPDVLRQIALWTVLEQDVEDATPDDAVWPWKKFLELLGHSPVGVEDDKAEDWAAEVAHTFTRRARLFDALLTTIDAEERDR